MDPNIPSDDDPRTQPVWSWQQPKKELFARNGKFSFTFEEVSQLIHKVCARTQWLGSFDTKRFDLPLDLARAYNDLRMRLANTFISSGDSRENAVLVDTSVALLVLTGSAQRFSFIALSERYAYGDFSLEKMTEDHARLMTVGLDTDMFEQRLSHFVFHDDRSGPMIFRNSDAVGQVPEWLAINDFSQAPYEERAIGFALYLRDAIIPMANSLVTHGVVTEVPRVVADDFALRARRRYIPGIPGRNIITKPLNYVVPAPGFARAN